MQKLRIIEEILPRHFLNSNVYNYVRSFYDSFDAINNDLIDLKNSLFIDTAFGEDLDIIANLFSLQRLQRETDDSFRNRIKSYFVSVIEGGSLLGIRNSVSAITGFNPDTINVLEFYDYFFREIYDFLNGTDYTGTGVTNDTTKYVEQHEKQSIKMTSVGASTITATNSLPTSMTRIKNFNALGFYVMINDFNAIDEITIKIEDNVGKIFEYIVINLPFTQNNKWYKIDVPINKITNNLDWENLDNIKFIAKFNDVAELNIDYLIFQNYQETTEFSVEMEVGDTTNPQQFDNIPDIINLLKPVGYTFKEFVVISRDKIFRYNLSGYNSEDRLV